MTQFGLRSTLMSAQRRQRSCRQRQPRFVISARRTAVITWTSLHGINVDVGIFMSYVGPSRTTTSRTWMYPVVHVGQHAVVFSTGVRVQVFPSDKLEDRALAHQRRGSRTESSTRCPGSARAQVLWRPTEWLSMLSNDCVRLGYAGQPRARPLPGDNSIQVKYYDVPTLYFRAARSPITADIGGESGNGVTPFGGAVPKVTARAPSPAHSNS